MYIILSYPRFFFNININFIYVLQKNLCCVIIKREGEVSRVRITDNQTLVLYAPIGEGSIGDDIYPRARRDEIARCKSEKVKREKYFAWKLLRKALTDHFNLDFDNLQFAKTANGQWICSDVFVWSR